MTKPENDSDSAQPTSPYLRQGIRPLSSVLIEQSRDHGRAALATWGRSVYLNIIEPKPDGPLFINDFGLVSGAALEAHDERDRGYRVTVAITPEGLYCYDLRPLGEHLQAHLPHIEPGNA